MVRKRCTYAAFLVTVVVVGVVLTGCSAPINLTESINDIEDNDTLQQTVEQTLTQTFIYTPTVTEEPTVTPTEAPPTETPTADNTKIPISTDLRVTGYYLEHLNPFDVDLFRSTVRDWSIEDSELSIKIEFLLYKKVFIEELKIAYPFVISYSNSNGDLLRQSNIDLDKDEDKDEITAFLRDATDNNRACAFTVMVKGYSEITDELMSRYINEEEDLEFLLLEITMSEKESYDDFKNQFLNGN